MSLAPEKLGELEDVCREAARTGTSRVRTDAWTRYQKALRQTVIRMEG